MSTGVCPHGLFLYENHTSYDGTRNVITGIPVDCQRGQYKALCNDGYSDPASASVLCRDFGYNGQLVDVHYSLTHCHQCWNLVPPFQLDGGEYDDSPRTSAALPDEVQMYTNLSCPSNATIRFACTADEEFACDNGPIGLTCYIPGTHLCVGAYFSKVVYCSVPVLRVVKYD